MREGREPGRAVTDGTANIHNAASGSPDLRFLANVGGVKLALTDASATRRMGHYLTVRYPQMFVCFSWDFLRHVRF